MDKPGVVAAISRRAAAWFSSTPSGRPTAWPASWVTRGRRPCHPRRPPPGGPGGASSDSPPATGVFGRDRRWRPGTGHRRARHRHPVRPAARSQDLPAPGGRTAQAGAAGLAVTLVLWNEELEVRRVKRRLGLDEPIVEMFSNDDRLADLAGWDPAREGAACPSTGEGVPGRVEVDPPRLALGGCTSCRWRPGPGPRPRPGRRRPRSRRCGTAGRARRWATPALVVGRQLEAQQHRAAVPQFTPPVVVVIHPDQRPVELGQLPRLGCVQHDGDRRSACTCPTRFAPSWR